MIVFGSRIPIVPICPDCEKPMFLSTRASCKGISSQDDSDLVSVYCETQDCINRGFISTIEKKTGVVIYTDAMYKYENDAWKPIYRKYEER